MPDTPLKMMEDEYFLKEMKTVNSEYRKKTNIV